MNKPINTADYIPADAPTRFFSVCPIVFDLPGRQVPLEIKISAPVDGGEVPVIVLSHGHGQSTYLSSWRGYGPLVDFYAARGFAVIQPTHQDSKALGLDPDGPEGPLFWRSRAQDMHCILDHMDEIGAAITNFGVRLDRSKIGAVGHSLGGHTVAMLAGMRVTDPVDGQEWNLSDSRVKAAVLLGAPGAGADLAAFASEHYPVLRNTDFSRMTTPALVVAGDLDQSDLFSARANWRTDAYTLSPGPKTLLVSDGAKHMLGGVSGYDVSEAQGDDDPEMLGVVQRMTWAYLRTALCEDIAPWREASNALAQQAAPLGHVETK